MEASGGSPAWWSFFQVDIGKEEPETLKEIDPHWRAKQWLQVAAQGITDEEVPWHELLILLTSGVEGAARSLAKHLVAAWQWNVKVRGEGMCPPTPSILNIGQFITDEEVAGGMGEPHWFMAYSRVLQWVGKAAHRRKWESKREALEIKASLLVHAFWHETDVDLTMASVKLWWEPGHSTTRGTMALPLTSSPISTSWLFASPPWKHGTKWCGQPRRKSCAHSPRPSHMVTVRAKQWISAL